MADNRKSYGLSNGAILVTLNDSSISETEKRWEKHGYSVLIYALLKSVISNDLEWSWMT